MLARRESRARKKLLRRQQRKHAQRKRDGQRREHIKRRARVLLQKEDLLRDVARQERVEDDRDQAHAVGLLQSAHGLAHFVLVEDPSSVSAQRCSEVDVLVDALVVRRGECVECQRRSRRERRSTMLLLDLVTQEVQFGLERVQLRGVGGLSTLEKSLVVCDLLDVDLVDVFERLDELQTMSETSESTGNSNNLCFNATSVRSL